MNHVLIDSFSALYILEECNSHCGPLPPLSPRRLPSPTSAHFAESTFKQSDVYSGMPKHRFSQKSDELTD